MWTIIFTVILLIAILRTWRRLGVPEGENANIKTAWETLYIPLLKPGVPNYILSDLVAKICGSFVVIKAPVIKGVMVNVTSLVIAKQIMKSSDWVNRFPDGHFFYDASFKKEIGLLFSNGEHWRQSRKLLIKLLHQCGFYRAELMHSIIQSEYEDLEKRLLEDITRSSAGSIEICPHRLFQLNTLNILCEIIMGYRLDYDDPKVLPFLRRIARFNGVFNFGATAVDIFPVLRYIKGLTYMDSFKDSSEACYEFFGEVISRKRKEGKYSTEPLDFVDYYLQEIDKHVNDLPNYFNDETLLVSLRDLVLAGSDTSTSVLEFAILYMICNPQIQEKVQAEIDLVVGFERAPDMFDKDRMVYTQAVLQEVLRCGTSIPMSARTAQTPTSIDKYTLPKDSLVAINLYSIHMDKKIWDEPHEFRPERFMDSEGKLINFDKILPFGFGKRMCVGEYSARHTMFIFYTSLLQKFTFSLPDNYPAPRIHNTCGITRSPVPYFVKISTRKLSTEP